VKKWRFDPNIHHRARFADMTVLELRTIRAWVEFKRRQHRLMAARDQR
jgi:hypothetical protein